MYNHHWDEIAENVNFNLAIDHDLFRKKVSLDSKILDFGCGYGRVSKILLDMGYSDIVGVDPSGKMIERARRTHPDIKFEVGGKESLPYLDNSFDAIVVCAVFTCITSIETRNSKFRELRRVLKPEGLLHMVEFCSEPSKSFTASIGVPMLYSTPLELRKLTCSLEVVGEAIFRTNTMGGNETTGYSLFARKSLNKYSQQGAAKEAAPLL